ncbi:thiol-disulfide oxidoreductase DCC family protein [Altericista sp. CCNU0014]|uniref:thiol-disulfide oxidoreductase DCC family protein n=1 Tax=Altericista sp. CCNU0014 TaxID=3082949 RepID=UPI00384BA65E
MKSKPMDAPRSENVSPFRQGDGTASYVVIYDGRCNLCSTLVQALAQLERGSLFRYAPMQDTETLAHWQITPEACEMGMILLKLDNPQQRWQGSDAAEEIARLLPAGAAIIQAYRAIPGLKALGDRTYVQVRDHRYAWFGRRSQTYRSEYPYSACDACDAR